MGRTYGVSGNYQMPVYLISSNAPWTFSEHGFISGFR